MPQAASQSSRLPFRYSLTQKQTPTSPVTSFTDTYGTPKTTSPTSPQEFHTNPVAELQIQQALNTRQEASQEETRLSTTEPTGIPSRSSYNGTYSGVLREDGNLTYIGDLKSGGIKHGAGKEIKDNKVVAEGVYKDDKRDGEFRVKTEDGFLATVTYREVVPILTHYTKDAFSPNS